MQIVESQGFTLIHAIVDSIWLMKEGASTADYRKLIENIQRELNLPISFEGKYRWIVFLPAKIRPSLPALTRYYGVLNDGRIKCRGIAVRRHDVPLFIKKCQFNIISNLAEAKNSRELHERAPSAISILKKYLKVLHGRNLDPLDLIIKKRLSEAPLEYGRYTFQSIAARQLAREGLIVNPGEAAAFLIVNERNSVPERRVIAKELLKKHSNYDIAKYEMMLMEATSNILLPLGYDNLHLKRIVASKDHDIVNCTT